MVRKPKVGLVWPPPKKICGCGCEEEIDSYDCRGRERRFKPDHFPRSTKGSIGLRGEYHPQFKGGKTLRSDGYILLSGNYGHPRADRWGRILEHILIMEKKIGRHLRPSEIVHHIDHNRSNNDPNNLELLDKHIHDKMHSHEDWRPSGQKCPHCQSIIVMKMGTRDHGWGIRQRWKCHDCNKRFSTAISGKSPRYPYF